MVGLLSKNKYILNSLISVLISLLIFFPINIKSKSVDIDDLLQEAKQALATLNNLKAIVILEKIIDSNFSDEELVAETHYLLGRTYYIENNLSEASKNLAIRHRDFKNIKKFKDINYFWLGKTLVQMDDKINGCQIIQDFIFSDTYNNSDYIDDAKEFANNYGCIIDEPISSINISNQIDTLIQQREEDRDLLRKNAFSTDLFNDAMNDIKNDDYELAVSKLKQVVQAYSVDETVLDRALYTLGSYYFYQNDYINAIKYFGIHKRKFEDKQISGLYVNSYYKHGKSLFEIGDIEDGCLIMKDLIFNKKFKNETQFINEAKATSKLENCNLAFDDDTIADSYRI